MDRRKELLTVLGGGLQYWQKVKNVFNYGVWPLWDAVGSATAVDLSTNGYHGSPTAVTFGVEGIGDGKTAASFNGVSSVININVGTFAANFPYGEFSFLIYGKVSGAGVWEDGATRRLLSLRVDGSNQFVIIKSDAANTLLVQYSAGGTAKILTQSTSTTGWFSVCGAVSKSGDVFYALFNGTQIQSTLTGLGAWAGTFANATISSLASTGNFHSGSLAYVGISTRILSLSELFPFA